MAKNRKIPDDALEELSDCLFKGRKLEAVKRCRECSGLDLKNAKKAVEELESSLRSEFPDKFPAPPRGKGCSVTAAVLFLVAAATYWQLGS